MTIPTLYATPVGYDIASAVSSATQSITVPTLSNGMLLVALHLLDNQDITSKIGSSFKWGGSSGTLLTEINEVADSGNNRQAISGWYYLLDPTPGTDDLYWWNAVGNITSIGATVYYLENVVQSSPVNAQNSGAAGSAVTSVYASITGTSTNSLTLYNFIKRDGTGTITITGATEQNEFSTGANTTTDFVAATAIEDGVSGGQDATASWSGTERASWAVCQIEGIATATAHAHSKLFRASKIRALVS